MMESASTRAIVSAVARRIGVAVLPYLLVKKDIQEGRVLQLQLTEPLERNLNIVYHRSKYLTGNRTLLLSYVNNTERRSAMSKNTLYLECYEESPGKWCWRR